MMGGMEALDNIGCYYPCSMYECLEITSTKRIRHLLSDDNDYVILSVARAVQNIQ